MGDFDGLGLVFTGLAMTGFLWLVGDLWVLVDWSAVWTFLEADEIGWVVGSMGLAFLSGSVFSALVNRVLGVEPRSVLLAAVRKDR